MKYEGTVISIGAQALQFLQTNRMLILFDETVPPALQDMVVVHRGANPPQEILPGDRLRLGKQEYAVLDVGAAANRSLRENGHCTLVFAGGGQAVLPGQIVVRGDLHPSFMPGETICFA